MTTKEVPDLSIAELERKLVTKLETRGVIKAKGNLECHIAPMIGLGKKSPGYAAAYSLLERMEKEGKIIIERQGPSMREVTLATSASSATESSKEDYMTETSELVETPVAEEMTLEVVMTKAEGVKLGRINEALLALQANADANGEIKGASGPIIMKELGVPKHVAADLNALLTELKLRKMSGPRSALVHSVPKEEVTITIEQLRAAEATRNSRNRKGKLQQESSELQIDKSAKPDVIDESSEPAESSGVEQPVVDDEKVMPGQKDGVGTQKPMLERLADAVILLRAQVKERDETINGLTERLETGAEKAQGIILRLQNDLAAAQQANREMSKLLKRVGAPNDRVLKVLDEITKDNTKE